MGEGFQVGNGQVMRALGKNIGILWGGRTSMQAGGERAGRLVFLTLDDARALAAESSMVAVVSPELSRGGVRVKSAYNAATTNVNGIERSIRTSGRLSSYGRQPAGENRWRVAFWFDMANLQPAPYSWQCHRRISYNRRKDSEEPGQQLQRSRQQQDLRAICDDGRPGHAETNKPRVLSDIIVTPKVVVDRMPAVLDARTGRIQDMTWPLERDLRAILARRHGFDPDDKDAVTMWDTSLQTMMFGRMIDHMKVFFTIVGVVTLALGGIGVMNIMLIAVKERTREIGVRKALGATTSNIQRQFFLEGFFLTMLSGGSGMLLAIGLCTLINLAPLPGRFDGMLMSWNMALSALTLLVLVGVVTSTYPARRAAELPPVEALRFEM